MGKKTWDDYWNNYDQLCSLLIINKKEYIALELKKVKRYVNGLTDGWHDFLNSFKFTIENHKKELSENELKSAEILLEDLRNLR